MSNNKNNRNTGHWTVIEKELFYNAIEKYGKDWIRISNHIKTRTPDQIRTFVQKLVYKICIKLNINSKTIKGNKINDYLTKEKTLNISTIEIYVIQLFESYIPWGSLEKAEQKKKYKKTNDIYFFDFGSKKRRFTDCIQNRCISFQIIAFRKY